jgi:DNA modification methylase
MGLDYILMIKKKLGRNYIGIELSPAYIAIAEKRLAETTKQLSLI